jgi:hypothetical protein
MHTEDPDRRRPISTGHEYRYCPGNQEPSEVNIFVLCKLDPVGVFETVVVENNDVNLAVLIEIVSYL